MSAAKPPFYDSLEEVLRESWQFLMDGVTNRRSCFHTLTVATLGLDGRPRARTVVSRAVDPEAPTLRFHCDVRTDKFAELNADPRIAIHAYNPAAKIQLRLEGRAALHRFNPVANDAWETSRMASRVCYGTTPAPGDVLKEGGDFILPQAEAEILAGRENFCAVVVTIETLEFLYLAHGGHRRARFAFEGGAPRAEWLVP